MRANGAKLADGLAALPHVVEVRGRGLLVGAELDRPAQPVSSTPRSTPASSASPPAPNVLRLAPPLVVDPAEVDRALEILTEVLSA